MAPRTTAEDLDLALRLQDRLVEAPQEVVAAGRALLSRPRLDAEVRSVGHRTLARALRALDRPQDSVREARRSAAVARRAGLTEREAEARLTLALCLFQSGRARAALDQIEQASSLASGETAQLVSAQHGILLARLGRLDAALQRYAAALDGPLPPADEARVLNNRGIALAFVGRVDESVRDLEVAVALAHEAGARMLEAEIVHNIGFALTVAGDIPGALHHFDQADAIFVALDAPIGLNLVARSRALLRANLHREARDAARAAVDALQSGGGGADVAEARVLLATAELAEGDADQAMATAGLARRALLRQGRPALAALAEHVIVRARVALGRRDRWTMGLAGRCAEALGAVGLVADEQEARLTAGLIARELARPEAATHLDAVRAHRDRGPLVDRGRGWYAEALGRLDDGDAEGARRAVAAGLDAVADLQALMGATELQVLAAGHGSALGELGLRLAVADGDPWAVLRLVDQWRSASLDLGRHPPGDPVLAADLAARRAAVMRLEAAAADGTDPALARRAVGDLEARIRARTRHLQGAARAPREVVRPEALRESLGGGVLLVHFEDEGRLGAVSVREGRAELHPHLKLGRQECAELIGAALFALRRLTRVGVPVAARSAAAASLADAMERLDDALVAPFVGSGASQVVICPTRPLHALPWSGLPSCAERPVSVVPSLRRLGAERKGPLGRGGRVVLAAGPGLGGALTELAALTAVYPDGLVFDATSSRVDVVLRALEGADVAHLACHGRLRADNPMFSSLDLADGPLTVFDLEKLERPPAVVVLAACDVGTTAVSAGDELLGLTAAFHRAGTGAVLASLVPVPDTSVVEMMVALHRGIAAGRSPADALGAGAPRALDPGSVLSVPLRSAFTCFGH